MNFGPELFRESAIDPDTAALNAAMIALMTPLPNWWNTSAAVAREGRRLGRGPFPPYVLSPRARTIVIEGRDGNEIPLRVIAPIHAPRGVYLHCHGGGWVLGSADMSDPMLERIADNTGLAVVSVEYRLAPEHPYPAGPDDCESAAAWLVANMKREFGCEALTIGGESAGGHLAAVTVLRMRDRYGYTGFRGANLVYGAFDLALFTVGTRDALLDDTLFMHARWVAAGNESELAIYPGGAHGFTLFPNGLADKAAERMDGFLKGVVE